MTDTFEELVALCIVATEFTDHDDLDARISCLMGGMQFEALVPDGRGGFNVRARPPVILRPNAPQPKLIFAPWTRDLGAATRLCPHGWGYLISSDPARPGFANVYMLEAHNNELRHVHYQRAEARTPALALAAAALKAQNFQRNLIHHMPENDNGSAAPH